MHAQRRHTRYPAPQRGDHRAHQAPEPPAGRFVIPEDAMPTKVCNVHRCPNFTDGAPRCDTHTREAERERGTARQRGYGTEHRTRFREGVLAKHPWCTSCHTAPSTVADHWPLDRRTLVERGHDPDDPAHGRGLCASCHGRATAEHQPGGWNR